MHWLASVLTVGLLLGLTSFTPGAQASSEQDLARDAHRRGEIMSLGEIMRNVKQRVDGRIISTHFSTARGGQARHIYTFEVLSDNGDLMRVHVDASNSVVLQIQRQRQGSAYQGRSGSPPARHIQGQQASPRFGIAPGDSR